MCIQWLQLNVYSLNFMSEYKARCAYLLKTRNAKLRIMSSSARHFKTKGIKARLIWVPRIHYTGHVLFHKKTSNLDILFPTLNVCMWILHSFLWFSSFKTIYMLCVQSTNDNCITTVERKTNMEVVSIIIYVALMSPGTAAMICLQ